MLINFSNFIEWPSELHAYLQNAFHPSKHLTNATTITATFFNLPLPIYSVATPNAAKPHPNKHIG